MKKLSLLGLALCSSVLMACGGTSTPSDPTDPTTDPVKMTVTRDQILACPLSAKSTGVGLAVPGCLNGTYVGKSFGSEDCVVKVTDGKTFEFSSKSVKFSFNRTDIYGVQYEHTVNSLTKFHDLSFSLWQNNDTKQISDFSLLAYYDASAAMYSLALGMPNKAGDGTLEICTVWL